MSALGWRTCSALPRGARKGDYVAVGCDVIEVSIGATHRIIAVCGTPEDAAACAAALNRKRGRR